MGFLKSSLKIVGKVPGMKKLGKLVIGNGKPNVAIGDQEVGRRGKKGYKFKYARCYYLSLFSSGLWQSHMHCIFSL